MKREHLKIVGGGSRGVDQEMRTKTRSREGILESIALDKSPHSHSSVHSHAFVLALKHCIPPLPTMREREMRPFLFVV